jgi:hypothetical protein
MLKTRAITAAAATIATTGLLAGAAFAWTTTSADKDDVGISTIARTTTAVGEAKGDVISAAARDMDDRATTEDNDRDADDNANTDKDAHGDAVSAIAHSAAKGPGHGDAVSDVASANSEGHEATTSSSESGGVSSTARSKTTTGEAHGDAVSSAARDH